MRASYQRGRTFSLRDNFLRGRQCFVSQETTKNKTKNKKPQPKKTPPPFHGLPAAGRGVHSTSIHFRGRRAASGQGRRAELSKPHRRSSAAEAGSPTSCDRKTWGPGRARTPPNLTRFSPGGTGAAGTSYGKFQTLPTVGRGQTEGQVLRPPSSRARLSGVNGAAGTPPPGGRAQAGEPETRGRLAPHPPPAARGRRPAQVRRPPAAPPTFFTLASRSMLAGQRFRFRAGISRPGSPGLGRRRGYSGDLRNSGAAAAAARPAQ